MATAVVPVHVDALFLEEPTQVFSPTVPYWQLPHLRGGEPQNRDVPHLSSAVTTGGWHGEEIKPGIHLHWSMPDALMRQRVDGSFPELPNRWAIFRFGGNMRPRQWLIESDALRHGERPHRDGVAEPVSCIPYEAADGRPPYAWLGKTHDMGGRSRRPQLHEGDRLAPFTMDFGGDVLFSALYSRCQGVFGFHDPEIDWIDPGLRYQVRGFHAEPGSDPLNALFRDFESSGAVDPDGAPLSFPELIAAELGWEIDEPTRRSCYFGTVDFPDGAPTPWQEDAVVEAAIGATTPDALAALEADGDNELEEALATMRFLAEHGRSDSDLEHALHEFRHNEGFQASRGDARWILRPIPSDPATRGDKDSPADPPVDPVYEARLAAALRQLVDAQRSYDSAHHLIDSLRHQLFADWNRYLLTAYPANGGPSSDAPALADMMRYITTEVLEPLERLIAEAGRIGWIEGEDHEHVRPRAEQRGRLAVGVDETWRQIAEALRARDGEPLYDLVLAPGPRFYSPREISIVMRGEAVTPTNRHNQDGRDHDEGHLRCEFSDIRITDDFEWISRLWEIGAESAGRPGVHVRVTVDGRPVAPRTTSTSPVDGDAVDPIGVTTSRNQPWHPLVYAWDADYEAVAYGGNGPYPRSFLTDNFTLHEDRPDLVARIDSKRGPQVSLAGWSLLTTGAGKILASAIDRYKKELAAHNADEVAVVAKIDQVRSNLDVEQATLSCTLNGLDDGLIMRLRSHKLAVADPFAPSDSGRADFASRVAHAVGESPSWSPEPSLQFNPLRTGAIRLGGGRLIDNFGLARPLRIRSVVSPTTMMSHQDEHALISPRLLRPARLRMRWLERSTVSHDVPAEMIDHPSSSPIHGWLAVSHLDHRVLVFDGDGRRLGSIEPADDQMQWVSIGRGLDDPVLRGVVDHLVKGDRSWFANFSDAIAEAQELIDPKDAGRHRGMSLLVSRPMAVVRAGLHVEFAGAPPHAEDWDSFFDSVRGRGRQRAGLDELDLPVRLGAPVPTSGLAARLDDGLLGFWVDGDNTLRAPKSTTSGPLVSAPGSPRFSSQIVVQSGTEPTRVTMLVDPRGEVHAVSGILPTKRLALDVHHVASALHSMEIAFRAGPILTRRDHIDHAVPTDPELFWLWADDETGDSLQAVEPLAEQSPLLPDLELRSGFLMVSPVYDE